MLLKKLEHVTGTDGSDLAPLIFFCALKIAVHKLDINKLIFQLV